MEPHLRHQIARRFTYVAFAFGVVFLDQLTKSAVIRRIPLYHIVPVIEGFFDLTHVQNTGAAFGLFASLESPLKGFLLTAVAFTVFVAVLFYSWQTSATSTRTQLGLAAILGGAVGNLIDRLTTGSVTDFLRFYIGRHEWPSFNVADSAISVGVCLLAWDLWREPRHHPVAERAVGTADSKTEPAA